MGPLDLIQVVQLGPWSHTQAPDLKQAAECRSALGSKNETGLAFQLMDAERQTTLETIPRGIHGSKDSICFSLSQNRGHSHPGNFTIFDGRELTTLFLVEMLSFLSSRVRSLS